MISTTKARKQGGAFWINIPYSSKFWERNFDRYWLFKYSTENILMDCHCISSYTCKCCIFLKQFHRLNFDGLAGKRQNIKISPIKILCYTVDDIIINFCYKFDFFLTFLHKSILIKPGMQAGACLVYYNYLGLRC